MKYSIIVATYNRLDEMKELTDSLQKIDFPNDLFELVVADDGSEDGTREFLEEADFNFTIRYLRQENKGPGAARNLGMSEAAGEYFLFIDSDCTLPEDYLNKIDESVKESDLDAFGGPDTYREDFPPLLKAINYSMTSFIGTGGPRGSKKSVTKFYPRSFNMGIHRKVYEEIGGMGKLRHGQDMDFSARIYRAGFKVGLIPDAVVFHKRRTNLKRFFKQIFNWGVARINLGRMHGQLLKPIHFAPASIVAGTLFIFLLAPFFTIFEGLAYLIILTALVLALYVFVEASLIYKSARVGLLAILTIFIQITAYGVGTWSGIFQWMTGKKTAKGFTKNYYK